MTQKERLVELMEQSPVIKGCGCTCHEYFSALADYLLSQGVIVPPCKVGDVVYDIGGFSKIVQAKVETMTTYEQEMSSVVAKQQKPFYRWSVDWNDLGKTVFFTREEAEQALKERDNNV